MPARRLLGAPVCERRLRACLICVALAGLLAGCAWIAPAGHPQIVAIGRFRDIHLYMPPQAPRRLALMLSGDGGWTYNIASIARGLTGDGTLVAGIDTRDLLASLSDDPAACISPGEDLAALARELRRRYAPQSPVPVIIGHSAGATFAYLALAQAPAQSFAGAITLSFCADLDLSKPLCHAQRVPSSARSGGVRLQPPPSLPAPWVAFHGLDDTVCPAEDSGSFARALPQVRFEPLPHVTHNYLYRSSWWESFRAAYEQLARGAAPPR
jgi:type IV secretory pathway VirJ component